MVTATETHQEEARRCLELALMDRRYQLTKQDVRTVIDDLESQISALRDQVAALQQTQPNKFTTRIHTMKESNGRVTHFVYVYSPLRKADESVFGDSGRIQVAAEELRGRAEREADEWMEFFNPGTDPERTRRLMEFDYEELDPPV